MPMAPRARVAGTMQRPMHRGRLATDVLHHVDLAVVRPPARVDVDAHHPERRPEALPARNPDSRLEAAVRLREATERLQPRRRVVARDAVRSRELLGARRDDQRAAFDARVLGAIGVGLELLVAPAAAAQLVDPARRIGAAAVSAVELVAPRKLPLARRPAWLRRRRRRRARVGAAAHGKRREGDERREEPREPMTRGLRRRMPHATAPRRARARTRAWHSGGSDRCPRSHTRAPAE